jgi:hypothetical protein
LYCLHCSIQTEPELAEKPDGLPFHSKAADIEQLLPMHSRLVYLLSGI